MTYTDEYDEPVVPMRKPSRSGWCGHGMGATSHARCKGGQNANPERAWTPCPCHCHFPEEVHAECECGKPVVQVAPVLHPDEWWHLDENGDATKEYC